MDNDRFDTWLRTLEDSVSRRGVLGILGGLGLAAVPTIAGAKRGKKRKLRGNRVSAASAPEVLDPPLVFDLPAGDPFCAFPVRLEVTGKIKTIELPSDRTIITAPGQKGLLTNLDTGKQTTLNITGSFHQTVEENGDQITVAVGRNILIDPVVEPHFGFTRGRFTYAFDSEGTLIQERTGRGLVTDVCALFS